MVPPNQPDPHTSFPAVVAKATRLDPSNAPENPLQLLQAWVSHVLAIEAVEPMYVCLATASADGSPSSRMVQLLEVDDGGLWFSTNFESRKGLEMRQTGRAAVSIYWRETAQSVNLTGTVEEAGDEENDRRFCQEPRHTQAARAVSRQGHPLPDERVRLDALFALRDSDAPIPRPDYWRWFRLVPDTVTFWEGHPDALNRRLHYRLSEGVWDHFQIEP